MRARARELRSLTIFPQMAGRGLKTSRPASLTSRGSASKSSLPYPGSATSLPRACVRACVHVGGCACGSARACVRWCVCVYKHGKLPPVLRFCHQPDVRVYIKQTHARLHKRVTHARNAPIWRQSAKPALFKTKIPKTGRPQRAHTQGPGGDWGGGLNLIRVASTGHRAELAKSSAAAPAIKKAGISEQPGAAACAASSITGLNSSYKPYFRLPWIAYPTIVLPRPVMKDLEAVWRLPCVPVALPNKPLRFPTPTQAVRRRCSDKDTGACVCLIVYEMSCGCLPLVKAIRPSFCTMEVRALKKPEFRRFSSICKRVLTTSIGTVRPWLIDEHIAPARKKFGVISGAWTKVTHASLIVVGSCIFILFNVGVR